MLIRILIIALLTLAAPAQAALPVPQIAEEAAEVEGLALRLVSATSGSITVRICDYCEYLTLRVESSTRAFHGKQPISLREAEKMTDIPATVLFDPKSGVVTRILLQG